MNELSLPSTTQAAVVLPLLTLPALMLLGVVLWLIGSRLARPACAVSGLVLGGLGGWAVGQAMAEQGAFALPLTIGAGIAGALLAALLFRIWMGFSGALLLALVVPAAVMVWQGTPPPALEALGPATTQPADATTRPAVTTEGNDTQTADADDADEQAESVLAQAVDAAAGAARTWYDQQKSQVAGWWEALGPAGRKLVLAVGLFAGIVGLVLGLALPDLTASGQTALVGAILILLPGRHLVADYAPALKWLLPQSPRGLIVWLGLITILGCLIQWTLFRKRADK